MTSRAKVHRVVVTGLVAIFTACASPPGGGALSYTGNLGSAGESIEVDAASIASERQAKAPNRSPPVSPPS